MEIFGKHIFNDDADNFRQMSVLEQVNWIKTYTTQQNDDLIDEFLLNIPENNDKNCMNCGNNISKAVPTEIEPNSESVSNGELSSKNNIKRPRTAKRRKD